jgi:hypothetical protein
MRVCLQRQKSRAKLKKGRLIFAHPFTTIVLGGNNLGNVTDVAEKELCVSGGDFGRPVSASKNPVPGERPVPVLLFGNSSTSSQ